MVFGTRELGCVLAVTAPLACARSEAPTQETPASAVASEVPEVTVAGDAAVSRFDEDDRGDRVDVRVHVPFEIELRSPTNPGYKFAWLPAEIVPTGVVTLRKDVLGPAKNVDGGSYRHVYRLRANRTGTFDITIANTSSKSQGEVPTYTLRVRVGP